MNIFTDNSLFSLEILLSEDIDLQGQWRVALTEITFPTHLNNVTDTKIVNYKRDKIKASLKVPKDKIFRPYDRETGEFTKSGYDEVKKLFNEINRNIDLVMHFWEFITFESPQIPSVLGFKGMRDRTGYHIGYEESSLIQSTLTSQKLICDYSVDFSAGTQLMFIYLDIIHTFESPQISYL